MASSKTARAAQGAALAASALLLSACAGGMDYSVFEGYMDKSDCAGAGKYHAEKEDAYGDNERLLYLLDGGMTKMLCGDYQRSNEFLHEAEAKARDLWTLSISKEAAAFLLNDYTAPYAGEDFERALINLFSAINYLQMGKLQDALVECRRLDLNLSEYNRKYDEKNVYKEDAFGRYLSALAYEADGNLEDAYIDYRKAYEIFKDYGADYSTPMPSILIEDFLRVAEATGRLEDAKTLTGKTSAKGLSYSEAKSMARVVFIHLNGLAPVKEEDKIILGSPAGPITLAFPRFVARRPSCSDSGFELQGEGGKYETRGELVEDINKIAVKNLADRKGRIVAKAIARAVAKQAALNAATAGMNDKERLLARTFVNIVNIAVEQADTRSWRTLPGEVYLSRTYVPEGEYTVGPSACGGGDLAAKTIKAKAGSTVFVIYETMY